MLLNDVVDVVVVGGGGGGGGCQISLYISLSLHASYLKTNFY